MGNAIADEPDALEPERAAPPPPEASSAPESKLLGAQLAQARREAGLTQRELADRLAVRLWMVDQWEAGAKPVPEDKLELITAAIGTPAAERILSHDADHGRRPAASSLVGSNDVMGAPSSNPLTAQQIRDAELPRSLRGYEEAATRPLLGELAAAYDQSVNQCDELRRKVEELESAHIDPEKHALVVAERDALSQRIGQLDAESAKSSADMDALLAERDGLRKRADELAAELTEQERTATPNERDELRQRVEELEQALAGYTESEQALTRALVAASRAGEELVKEAETEAQAILAEARRSAEESEREINDRRDAFEDERAAIMEELKREALASAHDDLDAVERAAKPMLEALSLLEQRIRAILPSQPEHTAEAELLDDLKAPPAEKAAATESSPIQ